jgi:hypothetical protein
MGIPFSFAISSDDLSPLHAARQESAARTNKNKHMEQIRKDRKKMPAQEIFGAGAGRRGLDLTRAD